MRDLGFWRAKMHGEHRRSRLRGCSASHPRECIVAAPWRGDGSAFLLDGNDRLAGDWLMRRSIRRRAYLDYCRSG